MLRPGGQFAGIEERRVGAVGNGKLPCVVFLVGKVHRVIQPISFPGLEPQDGLLLPAVSQPQAALDVDGQNRYRPCGHGVGTVKQNDKNAPIRLLGQRQGGELDAPFDHRQTRRLELFPNRLERSKWTGRRIAAGQLKGVLPADLHDTDLRLCRGLGGHGGRITTTDHLRPCVILRLSVAEVGREEDLLGADRNQAESQHCGNPEEISYHGSRVRRGHPS